MTTPKESIEMLNDLGSSSYEAAKSLGEINLRIMERALARQMDAFNLLIDGGLRNIRMVTEAKNPSDLMRSQVDLARELGERMLTEGRETVKLATESRDEYRTWFEQGLRVAGEKFSKLRPTAA